MKIDTIKSHCCNYFSGARDLVQKKSSVTKRIVALIKVLSLATVLVPFVVAIVYGVSSLIGRIKPIVSPGETDRAISGIFETTVRGNRVWSKENVPQMQKPHHFFKVVSPEGNISYIQGTHHVGIPLSRLHPIVQEKLHESNYIYTELGVTIPSIREKISPEKWDRLIRRLNPNPASHQFIDRLSPRKLIFLLTGSETFSMDSDIRQHALDNKKSFYNLDEYDAIFPNGNEMQKTIDGQIKRLVEAIDDPTRIIMENNRHNSLLQAFNFVFDGANFSRPPSFTSGSLKGVTAPPHWAPTQALDLAQRNLMWIPKVLPKLNSGGAFIACGARHLYTKDGVIPLLRDKGFTITKMQASA